MAKKIYAVRRGRNPGIYMTWEDCKEQVNGFSGAEYKSFPTREEAEIYLRGEQSVFISEKALTEASAYVDGSYDPGSGQFSCGVVFFHNGEEEHFSQLYIDEELAAMHNVAGEIKGAEMAMQLCLDRKIKSVTIYHDYEGIAKWCSGQWKAGREGTIAYKSFFDMVSQHTEVRFVKVKGHSGDPYNELADRLAREALGL